MNGSTRLFAALTLGAAHVRSIGVHKSIEIVRSHFDLADLYMQEETVRGVRDQALEVEAENAEIAGLRAERGELIGKVKSTEEILGQLDERRKVAEREAEQAKRDLAAANAKLEKSAAEIDGLHKAAAEQAEKFEHLKAKHDKQPEKKSGR